MRTSSELASEKESKFVGWHRAKRWCAWRQVVEAPDEATAWRFLLDSAHGGEKIVLAAGKHPDDKKDTPCRPPR